MNGDLVIKMLTRVMLNYSQKEVKKIFDELAKFINIHLRLEAQKTHEKFQFCAWSERMLGK